MIGIIYLRRSPSNKCYIGQTLNEYKRNWAWCNNKYYSGKKSVIDNARNKYKPENFSYEILFKIESEDKNLITKILNYLEIKYIDHYQTHVSTGLGYNVTKGGTYRIDTLSQKHKDNIAKSLKGKTPKNLKKIQQSETTKQANRDRGIPIVVYKLDGEFVGEYYSSREACRILNLDSGCASKVLNNKSKQTKGYILKFK